MDGLVGVRLAYSFNSASLAIGRPLARMDGNTYPLPSSSSRARSSTSRAASDSGTRSGALPLRRSPGIVQVRPSISSHVASPGFVGARPGQGR